VFSGPATISDAHAGKHAIPALQADGGDQGAGGRKTGTCPHSGWKGALLFLERSTKQPAPLANSKHATPTARLLHPTPAAPFGTAGSREHQTPEKGPRGRETELLTDSAWAGVQGVTWAGEDAARKDSPIERWLPGTSSVPWCRQETPARRAVSALATERLAIRKGASSWARHMAVCARNIWVSSDPSAQLQSIPRTSCHG
jgi:hypothetical protein